MKICQVDCSGSTFTPKRLGKVEVKRKVDSLWKKSLAGSGKEGMTPMSHPLWFP